jgi:hypothetical protein
MLQFGSLVTALVVPLFRLLLMLSLLFTGAAGAAGETPLRWLDQQQADCPHSAMATGMAASHAHQAEAVTPIPDCCKAGTDCSSECRSSCAAATTGVPPQPVVADRLPGRVATGPAPRTRLPSAPPEKLLRPPRTRRL